MKGTPEQPMCGFSARTAAPCRRWRPRSRRSTSCPTRGSARSSRPCRTGRRSRSCSSEASWSAAPTSSPRCTSPASSPSRSASSRPSRGGSRGRAPPGRAAVDREPARLGPRAARARRRRSAARLRIRPTRGGARRGFARFDQRHQRAPVDPHDRAAAQAPDLAAEQRWTPSQRDSAEKRAATLAQRLRAAVARRPEQLFQQPRATPPPRPPASTGVPTTRSRRSPGRTPRGTRSVQRSVRSGPRRAARAARPGTRWPRPHGAPREARRADRRQPQTALDRRGDVDPRQVQRAEARVADQVERARRRRRPSRPRAAAAPRLALLRHVALAAAQRSRQLAQPAASCTDARSPATGAPSKAVITACATRERRDRRDEPCPSGSPRSTSSTRFVRWTVRCRCRRLHATVSGTVRGAAPTVPTTPSSASFVSVPTVWPGAASLYERASSCRAGWRRR